MRSDNPRALARGLSHVQADIHGITILYRLPQVGLVKKYLKCKFTSEWAAAQLPNILAIFFSHVYLVLLFFCYLLFIQNYICTIYVSQFKHNNI